MSDLFKCGFCDFLFGILRRVMCSHNRRGSSDTCYRELGGRNTVHKPRITLTSSSESASDLTDVLYSPTTSCQEDTSNHAKISSREEDDTSAGSFEKELAKIIQENVMLSWTTTPLGAFCTIKRQGLSSSLYRLASPVAIDDCYPKQAELLLSRSEVWEFDTFHLHQVTGGHCLPALGMHLFKKYELINHFNLKPEHCWKLFHLIENNYHATNPYHNSIHASDVAQAVHCFIQQPPLLYHLLKIEILVVLLAAFTHDLDHPGVNQSYLVATQHPLAVMYKDDAMGKADRSPQPRKRKAKFLQLLKIYRSERDSDKPTTPNKSGASSSTSFLWRKKKQHVGSILECHHWRVAYGCIVESNILNHMPVQLLAMKTMLKDLILATDITRQGVYLDQFKTFLTRKNLDMSLAEHRLMVMQIALKTADISNPGRPWAISQKWSEKVCDEFYSQGDKERMKKIPISKLCDRLQDTVPSIQIGFFQNVVMPLYTEWHRYLKTELSLNIMTNIVHNANKWKREAQRSTTNTNKITLADQKHHSLRTHFSPSTERLLQEAGARASRLSPRRSSYSPARASKVKDALRRFSAPLHAAPPAAPPAMSEALLCGDPMARTTPRRSAEEIHRSRTLSRLELAMAVAADHSCSQERSPSPRSAGPAPTRASFPPTLRGVQLNGSPRSSSGVPAKDDDSTNGVRFDSFAVAEWDSDTTSTSGTTTAYPQQLTTVTGSLTPSSDSRFCSPCDMSVTTSAYPHQLSTVTGSVPTPSSDSRFFLPMTLDNASTCAAGSCEPVVQHVVTREECCDVLPRLVAPELMRRRGSAPVVVATSTSRRQTAHAEPRQLSASYVTYNVVAEAVPAVRRGSLPVEVMSGISAL